MATRLSLSSSNNSASSAPPPSSAQAGAPAATTARTTAAAAPRIAPPPPRAAAGAAATQPSPNPLASLIAQRAGIERLGNNALTQENLKLLKIYTGAWRDYCLAVQVWELLSGEKFSALFTEADTALELMKKLVPSIGSPDCVDTVLYMDHAQISSRLRMIKEKKDMTTKMIKEMKGMTKELPDMTTIDNEAVAKLKAECEELQEDIVRFSNTPKPKNALVADLSDAKLEMWTTFENSVIALQFGAQPRAAAPTAAAASPLPLPAPTHAAVKTPTTTTGAAAGAAAAASSSSVKTTTTTTSIARTAVAAVAGAAAAAAAAVTSLLPLPAPTHAAVSQSPAPTTAGGFDTLIKATTKLLKNETAAENLRRLYSHHPWIRLSNAERAAYISIDSGLKDTATAFTAEYIKCLKQFTPANGKSEKK